jgi:hypothetical protein
LHSPFPFPSFLPSFRPFFRPFFSFAFCCVDNSHAFFDYPREPTFADSLEYGISRTHRFITHLQLFARY